MDRRILWGLGLFVLISGGIALSHRNTPPAFGHSGPSQSAYNALAQRCQNQYQALVRRKNADYQTYQNRLAAERRRTSQQHQGYGRRMADLRRNHSQEKKKINANYQRTINQMRKALNSHNQTYMKNMAAERKRLTNQLNMEKRRIADQLAKEKHRFNMQRRGYETRLGQKDTEISRLNSENRNLRVKVQDLERSKTLILDKTRRTMEHYEKQITSWKNDLAREKKQTTYLHGELRKMHDKLRKYQGY